MAPHKRKDRGKPAATYTTFLDLVRAVSRFTEDDELVVATISHLLSSRRARAVRSMLPMRVVGNPLV